MIASLNWKRSCIRNAFLQRTLIGTLGMLLVVASCFAQSANTDRANLLKLDLFGPTSGLFYKHPNTRIRASLEFEHRFNRHISMVVDGEWDLRQYECIRLFVWPQDYSMVPEYLETNATQNQVGLLVGLRYAHWLDPQGTKFNIFAEARVGGQFRHVYLSPFSISKPTLNLHDFALVPRIRMGAVWMFARGLGVEANADLTTYKFLATGKRVIWPIVELHVVIKI